MKHRVLLVTNCLVLLLFAVIGAGCSSVGIGCFPAEFEPVDEPTGSWALAIADERAKAVLADYNAGPDVARDGGPFTLDQYSRDICRMRNPQTDMNLIVSYRLQVPVLFLGHPEHFDVLVCEQDGSTRVLGGM